MQLIHGIKEQINLGWQRLVLSTGLLAVGLFILFGCTNQTNPTQNASGAGPKANKANQPVKVAYVTNGIADFWRIAEAGAKSAAQRLTDVTVEVRMPPMGVEDQTRMVRELLARGIDGVAISPIDPANQGDLLTEVAEHSILITQDADAPNSPRKCYIGMDNYQAGRMCGELVKQALPNGGSVIIFVGRLGQDNAKRRRQGVIDELLDRPADPNRYDPPGQVLKGDKYTVLDTRTDDFDFQKAKTEAQDAIAQYPDLGCMVGLFAYNPPKMLQAVTEAGKVNQIQIVAFDEDEETLTGIANGSIYGTIVQNPFQYGFESVRILSQLARGDESVLPMGGFLDIPARKITAANVADFRNELNQLLGK